MAIWKEEVFGTRRCVNCGFLGKRSPQFDEVCFHASGKDRLSGIFNRHNTLAGGATNLTDTIPWCYVNKADFLKELQDIKATFIQADKVQEVIAKDRGCPSWYPWREFATPKEHFEEYMTLAMEQRREKFELKLEEINKEERKRSNRVMIWLAIAAIIFALAEVIAAILGITNDSWILRFFR